MSTISTSITLSNSTAEHDTIGNGGTVTVGSGGIAEFDTVEAGGQLIQVLGTVLSNTIDSGGTEEAAFGGTVSFTTVSSGGLELLGLNGHGIQDTVLSGGTLVLGPVTTGILASPGGVETSGTIGAGGTESISGLDTHGTVSGTGARQNVYSGGSAVATTVEAGGFQVLSGGTAVSAAISAGGTQIVDAGVASFTQVSSGGQQVVSAGSAVSAAILGGGEQIVSSGGTASATGVQLAGSAQVLSGGSGTYFFISHGGHVTDQGAMSFTLISGGTLSVGAGGVETSGTIEGAGSETVLSGGAASFTLISGGNLNVSSGGTAVSQTVGGNGFLIVSKGGLASAATVDAGGTVYVNAGVASAVTLDAGGYLQLNGAGAITGGTIDGGLISGGLLQVGGGTVSGMTVGSATGSNGGANTSGVVQIGVQAYPGIAFTSDTTVDAGGTLLVDYTATADATTVNNGGTLAVDSGGGTASATTVASGGELFLGNSNESAIATTVSSGGVISAVAGTIDGGTVLSGGTADLQNAYVSGLTVANGGLVSGATIGANGLLDINAGGLASGTLGFAAGGSGATLQLDSNAPLGATISGMVGGQTIDLTALTFVSGGVAFDVAGGNLVVTNGATTDTMAFTPGTSQTYALMKDAGSGTLFVDTACYAAGTRLATPGGAVAVEELRAGDAVLALHDGAWVAQTVRWVGRSAIDLARHPEPWRAAPIRIRAGAIAEGVPARDLFLSPDHAVYLDGALIQAQALLNGATVTQEFPARIDYLHVELDEHAVLLAEGLPAESYLDTGNRALFAGEAGVRPLHADLAGAAAWDERACAPLLLGGARVAAAHARVLDRAQALGAVLTGDAGLRVVREGAVVHLRSRSFVPAWLGLGPDRRRLGVAVASLRLGGRALPRAAFGEGWHAAEAGLRWTDGDAVLHLPRDGRLTLRLAPVGARYWVAPLHAAARMA